MCTQGDMHVCEYVFIHVDRSPRKWDKKNMGLPGLRIKCDDAWGTAWHIVGTQKLAFLTGGDRFWRHSEGSVTPCTLTHGPTMWLWQACFRQKPG